MVTGLIVPALLFALFHLAGFYYFPGGLQPWMQAGLFAYMIIYEIRHKERPYNRDRWLRMVGEK